MDRLPRDPEQTGKPVLDVGIAFLDHEDLLAVTDEVTDQAGGQRVGADLQQRIGRITPDGLTHIVMRNPRGDDPLGAQ